MLSSNTLNGHSTPVMVCPITNTNKKHPFHIELGGRTKTTGVILCDQVKILDIAARNTKFQEKMSRRCLETGKRFTFKYWIRS